MLKVKPDLPYQAPTYHIKPLVLDVQNEPLTYYDIKPFELKRQYRKYETADLPYQAPTYDIKALVLDFQNEGLTHDIKPIELNRQCWKYDTADQPYQAAAYDINPLTFVCQYTTSNCNISDPNCSNNCQRVSNFGTRRRC